jgi:peptidoglycan/xylan/chitin deacetylase (PgdA/CDA1 family)/uncharacterized caspase-like protein
MSKRIVVIAGCAVVVVLAFVGFWTMRKPSTSVSQPASNVGGAPVQPQAAPADPLLATIEDIVARYRKTIVLLEDTDSLPDAQRDQASLVGRIIFQENHQALSSLSSDLVAEIEAGDFSKPLDRVGHFLDIVESEPDLHDGDKLSFRDLLGDLADSLSAARASTPVKAELETRLDTDRKALAEIQSLYEKELDKIFGRFETRGMQVRREAWDQYVAYLHTKYKREEILKSYETQVGRINSIEKRSELQRDSDLETFGAKLPPKTFVLTFDDGPHPRYTDRILDILKKYQVKSVFFELGTNLATLKHNKAQATRAATAARHLVEAGFAVGSHGFSHNLLPKMSDAEIATEIDQTNRLLESVVNVRTVLFRPPYGGRDTKVLAAIEAHKMKSVMWNVDSKDWADPVAKSIANRVIGEARKLNHGIILLHDIHERTIDALPPIIETLKNDGYKFLSWDGQTFTDDSSALAQAVSPASSAPPPALYRESWAVVIGIDNYLKWPKLHYAVNDANGIKEILQRKYHFKQDHVISLTNEEATREKILSVLGDTLSNPKEVQKDDRVFIFFAGHGVTRKLPSGRDLGYIVPYDADSENFQGQSISMTNFQDISESIPAKHVFFVMDSCYSGLAITRGQAVNNYIREVSRRLARQMLTAGGANEEVSDNGPNGHSVFTWTILQGLEGRADLNSDGYISAAELASYVGPSVSALSHQTPAFGNLPGSEGGEFIFETRSDTEALSDLSTQLDQEAIQLNAELDRIRKEVAAKTARNEKLKEQLAAAKSEEGKVASVPPPSAAKVPDTAVRHLDLGDRLFKERHYKEALDEFLAASKMEPSNALALNNVGYMYYRLGKNDDAITWYQKTIQVDPRRAVAYVNLADLYYKLDRLADARPLYEKYLELQPNNSYAPTVRARLAQR